MLRLQLAVLHQVTELGRQLAALDPVTGESPGVRRQPGQFDVLEADLDVGVADRAKKAHLTGDRHRRIAIDLPREVNLGSRFRLARDTLDGPAELLDPGLKIWLDRQVGEVGRTAGNLYQADLNRQRLRGRAGWHRRSGNRRCRARRGGCRCRRGGCRQRARRVRRKHCLQIGNAGRFNDHARVRIANVDVFYGNLERRCLRVQPGELQALPLYEVHAEGLVDGRQRIDAASAVEAHGAVGGQDHVAFGAGGSGIDCHRR